MKHERTFHEDWILIAIGAAVLAICSFAVHAVPDESSPAGKPKVVNEAKGWFPKLESWREDPAQAFYAKPKSGDPYFLGKSIVATWVVAGLLLMPISLYKRVPLGPFLVSYTTVFILSVLAFLMASQSTVKYYNLEYVLWALLLGLLISNTVGVPDWLKPMLIGDSIIKMALVVFGAEVLFGKLVALGPPGIFTSWLVTPIVLVTTFWFGQRVLKISSPSLNMVISADMSVCGVSAAIATGAACRAKKEEVSYAIGVSLLFTAVMMVLQPKIVLWTGMDKMVGAAWMGGTIDSTGAVAAAGAILGDEAATVANTVKMIQNVLIGVIAFAVAAYWASRYREEGTVDRIGVSEIWRRFPKFVLGFLGASLVFSFLPYFTQHQGLLADTITKEITTPLRTWLFCLAFVAFGLETDFRQLWQYLRGGKPLILYLVGQAWSLILSLAMAYLMFGVLYGDKIKAILGK
ncbi:MAG: YeiH family protein [Planctomycetota bacterium]